MNPELIDKNKDSGKSPRSQMSPSGDNLEGLLSQISSLNLQQITEDKDLQSIMVSSGDVMNILNRLKQTFQIDNW